MIKSIGAVFAGLLFIVATHTFTDKILEGAGIFPPPAEGLHDTGLLLAATAYRTVFSLIGCYLTARLAPNRPMLHAMVIGVIGVFASLAGAVVSTQLDLGPLWYPLLLAASSIPVAWLGARLAMRGAG